MVSATLTQSGIEARAGARGHRTKGVAELAVLALSAETLFSVPYRSVYLARHSAALAWMAALVFACAVGLLFRLRWRLAGAITRLVPRSAPTSDRGWVLACLLVGVLLRAGWAMLLQPAFKSDGLAYFEGARELAQRHSIEGAFWPPGFSLFLAPFFAVFGARPIVAVLVSLVLFAATALVTYELGRALAGRSAGRVAVALFSVWPCHVTLAGVNSKETLLALLIPGAMLLYLRAAGASGRFRWGPAALSGAVIGFAALTQPAFLLFPAVIVLFEFARRTPLLLIAARVALFGCAMLVVILPWTLRNLHHFHRVVLISTNGGSVFYRANNPKANASYAAEGEESLPSDEFAADQEGYRAAKQWIVHHPIDFAVLMVRKQVVYLGDDGIGVYESMKRDRHPSGLAYAAAKGVSNLVWLASWMAILFGTPLLFRSGTWPLWFGLCFLPQLYQWGIDSVFESGSRHHLGYVSLVCVLVAMVLQAAQGSAGTTVPANRASLVA